MMNPPMLWLAAACVSLGGALSIGASHASLPLLALVIPVLFFLPAAGVAGWMMFAGLSLYGFTLPYQMPAISVAVWMTVPVLALAFGPRSHWQVSVLVICILLAMNTGILALQSEGKLPGSAIVTVAQVASVCLVWFAARCWKFTPPYQLWPLLLVAALLVAGHLGAAALAICVSLLIYFLQELRCKAPEKWLSHLIVILPAIAFAALVLHPKLDVPSPVFVAWILTLSSAWLGEYLIENEDEEEEEL